MIFGGIPLPRWQTGCLSLVCENDLPGIDGRSLRFREAFAPCYATGGCYWTNATCGSLKRSELKINDSRVQ